MSCLIYLSEEERRVLRAALTSFHREAPEHPAAGTWRKIADRLEPERIAPLWRELLVAAKRAELACIGGHLGPRQLATDELRAAVRELDWHLDALERRILWNDIEEDRRGKNCLAPSGRVV